MAFGFGGITASGLTRGFRSSEATSGFNFGRGARSGLVNFLKKEFSYTEIFGQMVQYQQQLSSFNWNATDEELKKKYEAMKLQGASALGGLVGRGIGSTLAVGLGGAAGLVVPKISSGQLAKKLIQAGSEDARDEIIGEMQSAMQQFKGMAINAGFIEGYINFRTFLKNQPESVLKGLGYPQQTIDFIKNRWGEKGSDPLVLQEALEETIESITDPLVEAFVEEAVDEFFESFIETGFVIAGELDSNLRQYQLDRVQTERRIELRTLADEPLSERFIINGTNYEEADQEIRERLQDWRLINSRDIGQIVTQDVEILEQHPQLRKLEITFRSRPHPPWINLDGSTAKTTTLTIPNFKEGLTWERLKRELKYNIAVPAYTWGNSVAVLKFTDKRKIRIQFDSVTMSNQAVEGLLKNYADLSNGIIKTITVNDYIELPNALRNNPIGMFPISCKFVGQNLTNLNNSNANRLPQTSYSFPLWTENEPDNFSNSINIPTTP
ncbi:MAG: hypothetical protein GW856_02770 [Cyanobacteria bacterium]|nr:hypothetical protein [Cyanobacteria bacterium CG_2015-16_32_12]